MGIIANYYAISYNKLSELLPEQLAFEQKETISDNNTEQIISVSLDKIWDSLHFLLTGYNSNPELNNEKTRKNLLLYLAFFGEAHFSNFETSEDFSYIPPDTVFQISQTLEIINFINLLNNINFQDFQKNNIYPQMW